ncbi:hypothetical protein BC830DRAFT_1153711, partial [Chytriomyces sp. MP71]
QPHPARDDHPLVAALQRENSALLQQNSGLNARIARLERQLSDARDGNDHLITRISELDADKQRLRKTVRDLRTEAMRSKRKESNQPPSQSNHSPFSHSCDESSTTPTPSKIYPTLVTSSALSLESPLRVAFMPPRPYPLSATNSNSYSVDHPIVNSPISSVPDSPSIISGVLSLKHQLHQAQVESQLKDALSTIQSLTGMLSVSDTALESALLENGHLREELGRVNEVSEDLRLTVEELRMQQLEQDTNTSMAGLEDSVVDGSLWLDRESGEEGPLDASDQKLALVDVFQDQQDINQTALKGSEEQGQEVDISGLYETAPQSMMHSFGEDDDLVLPSTPISALRSFVSIAPSMSLLDELKSSTGSHLEKAMPATLASSSSLMRTSTPQLQHPSSSTFSSSHSNVTPSRISRADRRRVSPGTLPIGLGLAYDTTCEVRIPRLGSVAAVASQIANSPQEGPLRILDCARIEGVRDASFEGRSDSGICVVDGRRKMEEAGWTLEARDGRVGVLFAAVALAVDYCTKNFG